MWTLLNAALASGLDADGLSLPPTDGSLDHPSLFEGASALNARQVSVGLRTALLLEPLVGQGATEQALVPIAGMAYLQGEGMALSWLGARASVPIRWLAPEQGAAIGDPTLQLLFRPVSTDVFGATIDAGTELPIGPTSKYAGSGRVVPRLGASVRVDQLIRVDARAAIAWEGTVTPADGIGGPVLDGGLGLGFSQGRFGGGLSARADIPLASPIRDRRGVGIELGAHGAARVGERIGLNALVSRALTNAAGTPVWRFGLGLDARLGSLDEPGPRPEALPFQLVIVDPDGRPVPGAVLGFDDGTTIEADASGRIDVDRTRRGDRAELTARGLVPTPTRIDDSTVTMDWIAAPVLVEVSTITGDPVTATVLLDGAPVTSDDQRFTAELRPGAHELRVTAEGYGAQTRAIEVPPRRVDPVEVEVVLTPATGDASLALDVRDPTGRSIEGAEVRVDGNVLGTTTTGRTQVEGLEATEVTVAVDAPYYRPVEAKVDLTEGAGTITLNPYYAPGTIRVVAQGPDGPIQDGLVVLEGPRALPPIQLSPLGERLIRLAPGEWDVLLSSPAMGLQERRIRLDDSSPVPVDVVFRLLPEAAGTADVILQVTDRDGSPLSGVEVSVDGMPVGLTSTEGQLRLTELLASPHQLALGGTSLQPVQTELVLHDGLQEAAVTMDWDPGSLRVAARTSEGPADAMVMFDGPTTYEGGRLGPPGRRLFQHVPAGKWMLVASHEAGMEVALTVLEENDPSLTEVDIRIGEEQGDAQLDLRVQHPDGSPVDQARVFLDGLLLAETASGGHVRVSGLVGGPRALRVEALGTVPHQAQLELPTETTVTLPFAPAVIDLTVTRGAAPVDDALVFFEGPTSIEPIRPGADGRARVPLAPGEWTMLVSSAAAGLAERSLSLLADDPSPQPVSVELDASSNALLVRVMDDRGQGVSGVSVLADGVEAGRTGPSGTATIERTGGMQLALRDARLFDIEPVEVPLERDEQLLEVAWKPVRTPVRAQADGQPVRAEIRAIGPRDVAPFVLGPDGEGSIALTPGQWQLLASAPDHGVMRKTIQIQAGEEPAPLTFDLRAATVAVERDSIRLEQVRFGLDQDVAAPEFDAVLEEVAATIIADPRIVGIEVQGHTDSSGSPDYNFELSRRRARSVMRALIARGVPPDLLEARGYGPTRPIATNDTEDGRATNRRVHFRITREDSAGGGR